MIAAHSLECRANPEARTAQPRSGGLVGEVHRPGPKRTECARLSGVQQRAARPSERLQFPDGRARRKAVVGYILPAQAQPGTQTSFPSGWQKANTSAEASLLLALVRPASLDLFLSAQPRRPAQRSWEIRTVAGE